MQADGIPVACKPMAYQYVAQVRVAWHSETVGIPPCIIVCHPRIVRYRDVVPLHSPVPVHAEPTQFGTDLFTHISILRGQKRFMMVSPMFMCQC